MADEIVMGSAVKGVTHIAAFDTLAKTRFDAFELEKILVSMFDTVDARLLDVLAAQYDMLGYNGWILAETEQEKRELLKAAIDLKKITGTPAAIREVVKRLGFLDVVIQEGWDYTSPDPVPVAPWAYFKVVYTLPGEKAITEEIANNLVGLINNYKPARSKLQDFGFSVPQQDRMSMRGEVTLKIIDVATNNVLEETTQQNTIYFDGMQQMLVSFGAKTSTERTTLFRAEVSSVGFGTSNTASDPVAGTPSALTDPTLKAVDNAPTPSSGFTKFIVTQNPAYGDSHFILRHYFSLASGEGNGKTLRELGLIVTNLNNGSETKLYSRLTRAPIVKTSAIRIEGYWDLVTFFNTSPAY